jgi:two-component system cell cycle response regulator
MSEAKRGKRASTKGGGGTGVRPRPTARAGSKAGVRADSVVEVDDEQLVDEADASVAATGPKVRVALHEQSVAQLGLVRMVVDTFRHTVVAAGSGSEGVARVLAAMRSEDPPGVVITAVPGGEPILDAAKMLEPRRPIVVITGPGGVYELAERAERLGGELYAVRPHEPDRLGPVLAAAARLAVEREELVAIKGAHQVLRQKVDQMAGGGDSAGIRGFEMFQRVLELELKRARRYGYPLSVGLLELSAAELPTGGDRILRARATAAIVGAVRDIDLVTELDDGRYLVLLPYTDTAGAENVAIRLVGAVASQPPVTIGDVSAQSSLRVGVAGARPGQPLSFARLMKDANAALGRAREDNLDLVVLS